MIPVVLDEELYVISASHSFYSTFSVEPEQTAGRQLDAVDEGRLDIAALRGFLDRLRNGEGVIEDHEINIDVLPRGTRSLLVRALEISDEPLATRKILLAIEDITERKHTAEGLEAAKRQAEYANLVKSRFLAAASHDLRQPLQSISLLQEILAKQVKDETTLALVGKLDETVSAMSSMLDTLLDINQREAGIVRRETVDFPINVALDHLQTQFSLHATAHGLGWRVVPSSLSVRSDPRLLEHMIRNLLSNAVKYTDKGKILLGAGGAATSCASRSGVPGSAFLKSNFRRFSRSSIKSTIRRASATRASASVSPSSSAWQTCWVTLSMSVPVRARARSFTSRCRLGEARRHGDLSSTEAR